jgi:hypothetical protein
MNQSKNADPNTEWYYYSIIFARALSLKIKEGDAIVVTLPNEETDKKIIVSHKLGMMHVDFTDDPDLKEGDEITI